jgi:DNA-dependent RNA polymerase auxiliary subunit epsilon
VDSLDDKSRREELEALLREVDSEINRALLEENVFSIEAYGWLDHETPDRK